VTSRFIIESPPYASVKFACAFTSCPANSARANFGNAAAAIMAALSVDKPGERKYTGYASLAFRAAVRKPELRATPPEIISVAAQDHSTITPSFSHSDFVASRCV
jgi:hypothetical protein